MLETAMQLRNELIEVLGFAGLELQKWTSDKINLISYRLGDTNNNKSIDVLLMIIQ